MFEIIAYIVTGVLAVAIGLVCGNLYVEHQEFQRRRMMRILEDNQKRLF